MARLRREHRGILRRAKLMLSGARTQTIDARRVAVTRVIVAMHDRLDEALSLEDLAEIAYISPFHFNRVFHQITGIPPAQFLYALRLETAKLLFLGTKRSVTDVCYSVGYNSLGTFTSRFTQLVGLSPCHLRRLADRISNLPVESLLDGCIEMLELPPPRPCVTGWLSSPTPFDGVIFVGLFQTPIPQRRPVAGTLLASPGPFRIGPVPDGRYYIFAAALPRSRDPLAYLLPDMATLLVGAGQAAVEVQNSKVLGQSDVTLRPARITDPPILITLFSLLTGLMNVQCGRALDL